MLHQPLPTTRTATKLDIDFTTSVRMVRPVPNDPAPDCNRDLIQELCLEAGRIMEDTSAELARVLPHSPREIALRVERFREAAETILALAMAAHALTH